MSLVAGAVSLVSVGATKASVLVATPSSAGTPPYAYQWYKSTDPSFSPGGGNIIAGATALQLNDTGLIPGTQYYYKNIVTDSAGSPATSTSAALSVATTLEVPNQNQFAQSEFLGVLDLRFNPDTVSVQIDSTQVVALSAGSAVKIVDSADGIPKVVGCTADTDEVLGFIIFDIKSKSYKAGDRAEISMSQNVMYLRSTGAIGRGVQVCLDVTTIGGVRAIGSATSGDKIVGWAYDKAVSAGTLIRIKVGTPSFTVK